MTIDIPPGAVLTALTRVVPALKEIQCPHWISAALFKRAERSLTSCLLPWDEPLEMVVGKANQQALREGKKDSLSPYLANVHSRLDSFYGSLNPTFKREPQDFLDDNMLLRADGNVLLLGGPIANEGTARLGGYDRKPYVEATGTASYFPVFAPRNGIALGFNCGDEDYGLRCGAKHEAWRYEKGIARKGAVFAVRNARSRKETIFRVDDECYDGKQFIREEGLIITKMPRTNREADNKSIVIIGGAHGFSSEAFADDLIKNLATLKQRTQGMRYYQVFVPCAITHDHSRHLSYGKLQWDDPRTIALELSREEL
jgi:hypothetical protein